MGNAFDSTNYPTCEPDRLTVGDRWTWKRSDLTDYPVASYALTYSLRLQGTGATEIEITASESGSEYLVEIAAATTAAYTAGTYDWQAYITRTADSERVTIGTGIFEVIADRAESTADPRSHSQIMLDAIEGMLEGKTTDVSSYSIGDRSLTRMAPAELVEWMEYYRKRVSQEQAQTALDNGQKRKGAVVHTRFR